jgi:L-threonylcarbamoyladenylate synthase
MEILYLKRNDIKEAVKSAVSALKKGRVVLLPTDTVYGLVSLASDKKAVERIFKIKKRPKSKPLLVFVKNIVQAKKIVQISKDKEIFLKKTWPGRVTVVLKKKNNKEKIYGTDKNTLGLRIPKYIFLNEVLDKINKPLVQTSANISGKPDLNDINKIIKQFSCNGFDQPDLIINAGNLKKSLPSSILDISSKKIKILRS